MHPTLRPKFLLTKTKLLVFWLVVLLLIALAMLRHYVAPWKLLLGNEYTHVVPHVTNFLYSYLCVWAIGTALYMVWRSWKAIFVLATFMALLNLLSESVLTRVQTADLADAVSGILGVALALAILRLLLRPERSAA